VVPQLPEMDLRRWPQYTPQNPELLKFVGASLMRARKNGRSIRIHWPCRFGGSFVRTRTCPGLRQWPPLCA